MKKQEQDDRTKQSEEEALELIDGFTEGSWIVDCISGNIKCSEKWERRIGLDTVTESERLSYVHTLVHPDDTAGGNSIEHCMEAGMARFDLEYRIKTVDSGYIWTQNKGKIVYDRQGRAVKVYAATIDITKRKRADEALRNSEQQLRLATHAAGMYTWELDIITGEIRFSGDVRNVIGFSYIEQGDVFARIERYTVPEDGIRHKEAMLRTMRGEGDLHSVNRVFNPETGEMVWLETHATLVRTEDGRPRRVVGIAQNITERKRAEKALYESEKKYRSLFENMTEMFQILEPIFDEEGRVRDFRYIEVNKATEILTGKKREEMEGRTALELYEIVEDYWFEMLGRALNTSEPVHMTEYSKAVDLYYDVYAWNAGEGKVAIVFSNITERKRAEEALRESEEKYRLLFDSIDEGFCIIEVLFDDNNRPIDYRFLEVNKSFERQTGLVDAKGRFMRDMAPEHEQHWFDIYGSIVLTGEPVRFQNPAKALGRFYDVYAFRVGEPGQRRVAILFNDIIEHKQAEEILTFQAHTLASLQEAICAVDENFNITFWNEMAEKIFGWTAQEAIGSPSKEIFNMISPSNREESIDNILKNNGYTGEAIYRNKDGKEVHASVICSIMRDAQGNYKGNVSSFRDITERKRMENALRESEKKALVLVKELEMADRNKNEFIGVLSHELRNPLAVITAGFQLQEVTQDTNQIEKAKEIMKRQMNQLTKLVEDLLDLTRINQNKIKLKKENIILNKILSDAVEDIRPEFDKKGISLGIKIKEDPVMLNADPVRVTQAIGNILFNALKFTRSEGKVWISLKTEKEHAVICIKDNGEGMSNEVRARLFIPFTQADNSLDRSSGGLGLGLSIVKGIVDLHEGTVSAFSEGLGKGSAFTIRLPIITGKDLTAEKPKSDNDGKKNQKLLIIEDNKDFADLLNTMLSSLGYTVNIAYNGESGVKLAKQVKPDVIICDIGLPCMNGYDVAESIRNDYELKKIKLIALTGYAGESDLNQAKESGFDKHVAKPVSLATIKLLLDE